MRHHLLTLAVLASLLAAAGPATALYVATPLHATASQGTADVGDAIDVTIAPENETTAAQWRSKLVRAYYAYDTAESSDEPATEAYDATYKRVLIDDALALDADARGALAWTVPAEVDDHNVAIRIESADGELLAIVDVAVGNAPAVMRAFAGTDGGSESLPPATGEEQNVEDSGNDVPAVGTLAALAVLGVAALAMRRRIS